MLRRPDTIPMPGWNISASLSYIAITRSVSLELIAASYALCARKRPASSFDFDLTGDTFFAAISYSPKGFVDEDTTVFRLNRVLICVGMSSQRFQQCSGLNQIWRFRAFGEPLADGSEEDAGLLAFAAAEQKSCQG